MIFLWVLLGSIIDPNVFLVYTSSALTFVAFLFSQISQAK